MSLLNKQVKKLLNLSDIEKIELQVMELHTEF
jgi:phosphoenolpyruvate-protein phosphotransferase (PTS system enzyme I)